MITDKEKEILQMFIDGKLDFNTSIWLIQDLNENPRCEAEICDIHTYATSLCLGWVQYDKSYDLYEVWDEGDVNFDDYGETWVIDFDTWKQKMKEKFNIDYEEFKGE